MNPRVFRAFVSCATALMVIFCSGFWSAWGSETPKSTNLPDPLDPLERLYGRKQLFYEKGVPTVTVMLMEGQDSVSFIPQKRMRLIIRNPLNPILEAPPDSVWTVRIRDFQPGEVQWQVQVGECPYADSSQLMELRSLWEKRGFPVRDPVFGSLYGIAGHVLDTRRHFIFVGEPTNSEQKAKELLLAIQKEFGFGASLVSTVTQRPHGQLEVIDSQGRVHAVGNDLVQAISTDESKEGSFLVKSVEFGTGYSWQGQKDRIYRGSLYFVVDQKGGIIVVNYLPLESYLRGIVASEIYASAHPEALKAQAVAARGQVLSKLGTRHLTDPYLLCSSQHCQVYSGLSGEHPATDAAIQATAGEALFAPHGGPLVDTVYSAACGGHTENNETAWGGMPLPYLRGRSDFIRTPQALAKGINRKNLSPFLHSRAPAYCGAASLANSKKYRWEKDFSPEQIDLLAKPLGIGSVRQLRVEKRGISGRVNLLTLVGEKGSAPLHGELSIRRFFANLNSSLFQIHPPTKSSRKWVFEGAGWGHGVGMCQMGAMGRAEHGQSYREILRHYYHEAEIVRLY